MIRYTLNLVLLSLVMVNTYATAGVEDLGINISSLNSVNSSEAIVLVEPLESKLSDYAYSVGFDVSNISQDQLDAVVGSYDKIPSAIFCEEHEEFEVQLSGNSIWERTKLMKLQNAVGPISTVH